MKKRKEKPGTMNNLSNRAIFTILGILALVLGGLSVVAVTAPNPGHGAEQINLNIDGSIKSLQQAIDEGYFDKDLSWGSNADHGYNYPYHEIRWGDGTGWYLSFVRDSDGAHLVDIEDNGNTEINGNLDAESFSSGGTQGLTGIFHTGDACREFTGEINSIFLEFKNGILVDRTTQSTGRSC